MTGTSPAGGAPVRSRALWCLMCRAWCSAHDSQSEIEILVRYEMHSELQEWVCYACELVAGQLALHGHSTT